MQRVSSLFETVPLGGPAGQGMYFNAVAELETVLDPFELLRVLQQIEAQLGRVRTVRWGARTLDLDLLLYEDRIIETPDLKVPHPRLATRRFVLEPLSEIAPLAVEPVTKRTIAELLVELGQEPK